MLLDYAKRYGPPQPAAIWGYEAMSLLLGSIARASDSGTRVDSSLRRRLGTVCDPKPPERPRHLQHQADGATTIRRYGVYRVLAGRLSFWKVIDT